MAMMANYGDSTTVAGAGLGVMFINMFVYGTFEGLNGAIDTLVSQSHGAKLYTECNRVFNKARIINTIIFIPIAIVLILSDKFLILLGQPADVAVVTQRFVFYQLPGLFLIAQFDTLRRYLQAQGSFKTSVYGLFITNVLHIGLLTVVLKYIDYDPIILCSSVTNFTMMVDYVILRYIAKDSLKETNKLHIFDGAFTEWWEYLELALPSAFIICAEWWMYEVLAIFAGLLGIEYLATIVIIFNVHNFVYDISYGLSQAASSLIGRTLAESGKEDAKKLLFFIYTIQCVLCVLMTLIYFMFSQNIIRIFTDDIVMVTLYTQSTHLIIIMFIIDSTQIVLGGVIRGIGEQGDSSIISFISYGLITLPFALLLSFWFDYKLAGILVSYIMGILFNTVFNTLLLLQSKWELAIDNYEPMLEKSLLV